MKVIGPNTTEISIGNKRGLVIWTSHIFHFFLLLLASSILQCNKNSKVTTDDRFAISREEAVKVISKGTGYPVAFDFFITESGIPRDFILRYGAGKTEEYLRVLKGLDSAGYIKVYGISDSLPNHLERVIVELTGKGRKYFKKEGDSTWKAQVCKIDVLGVDSLFVDTFYIGKQKMGSARVFYTQGYCDFAPFYYLIKPFPYFRTLDTDSIQRLRARLFTYEHGWRVHFGVR